MSIIPLSRSSLPFPEHNTRCRSRMVPRGLAFPFSPAEPFLIRIPRYWPPSGCHDRLQAVAGSPPRPSSRPPTAQRLLSFRPNSIQPGHDPRPDHRSFKLREHGSHLHHGFPEWRGAIHPPVAGWISVTPAASSSAIAWATWSTLRPRRSIDQMRMTSNR
jgi:hypothetical protein